MTVTIFKQSFSYCLTYKKLLLVSAVSLVAVCVCVWMCDLRSCINLCVASCVTGWCLMSLCVFAQESGLFVALSVERIKGDEGNDVRGSCVLCQGDPAAHTPFPAQCVSDSLHPSSAVGVF